MDTRNQSYSVGNRIAAPAAKTPSQASASAAEHKRAMEGVIRALAAHVGAADPAAFAYELSLVMEGAHVTRRVTGNNATAAIARRVGARLVELPIPAGPGAAAPVGRVPALYAGGDLSPDRRSDAGLVRASNIR